MKRALLVLLMIPALTAIASAGQNPYIRAYIDFDPPNYVHEVYPAPYTVVTTYLVLDCFDWQGIQDAGMWTISLCFSLTEGMSLATGLQCLLPGIPFALGDWETGTTLSGSECAMSDGSVPENNGIVLVARIDIYYSGEPGDILIMDHPNWPRLVTDCHEPMPGEDHYRILAHGALGKPHEPGDPGADFCGDPSPVEGASWGTIKGMFR
jgi:hypothetical protein